VEIFFSKKFCARDSDREEKFLSSSRVVNATRVVQEKGFHRSNVHRNFFGFEVPMLLNFFPVAGCSNLLQAATAKLFYCWGILASLRRKIQFKTVRQFYIAALIMRLDVSNQLWIGVDELKTLAAV
jgi:hypothetical protein